MINYYLLTKPGIILGNLITLAAGFLLASKGSVDFSLFFVTLIGLALVIASACVFNNYIDRNVDRKMKRTQSRPLALGLISGQCAILFGILLGLVGILILFVFTNLLTALVAGVGFFVYVVLYSLWKCRTIYGTAIGSIAGAIPPVVGYCAVSNQLDAGALILFMLLVMWQMPHFFSIAIWHLEDYQNAKIPVLPVKRGIERAKIHMVLYILSFLLTAGLLRGFHYIGDASLLLIGIVGLAWFGLCLKGFTGLEETKWGHQMFRCSLLVIIVTCLSISFNQI